MFSSPTDFSQTFMEIDRIQYEEQMKKGKKLDREVIWGGIQGLILYFWP